MFIVGQVIQLARLLLHSLSLTLPDYSEIPENLLLLNLPPNTYRCMKLGLTMTQLNITCRCMKLRLTMMQ